MLSRASIGRHFVKWRVQPLQVCAHAYQSRAKHALVCLTPGYQSLTPKTSICSIFSQNPCLVPLFLFLPGLPTPTSTSVHTFLPAIAGTAPLSPSHGEILYCYYAALTKIRFKSSKIKKLLRPFILCCCPWPPFCNLELATSSSARPCISEQSKACTCLFVTRLTNFVAQDIFLQNIFTESTFISFNFFLTRATHPPTSTSVHTF